MDRVRWAAIRDRIFGRIDAISAAGERYRAESANIQLFRQRGRFVADKTLRLDDGTELIADRYVIAAGSRVRIPPVDGLDRTPYETSDTVMRLPELPRTMIIVGAGYVAAEFAHVFSAYGTAVTVVGRRDRMLRHEDADISELFTRLLGDQVDLRLRHELLSVRPSDDGHGVVVEVAGSDGPATLSADVLLLATGRIPNGDRLDLDRTGVSARRRRVRGRRRLPADDGRPDLRARRRQLAPPAQARGQSRGQGGTAQPAASRCHGPR